MSRQAEEGQRAITPGLENMIHAIAPGARPAGRVVFPPAVPGTGIRRKSGESAREWLRRCVDDHFDGDANRVAVEPNLALILVVHWECRFMTYANIQVLWAEAPLREFLSSGGGARHRYLRLDYDPKRLGPLLKEPFPHVHVDAGDEPRFPVPVSVNGDVVGWFFDFVYRNFLHDEWMDWVKSIWDRFCDERNQQSTLPRLQKAFEQDDGVLIIEADRRLCQDLAALKRCIDEARARFFPVRANAERWQLLSHEAADS